MSNRALQCTLEETPEQLSLYFAILYVSFSLFVYISYTSLLNIGYQK